MKNRRLAILLRSAALNLTVSVVATLALMQLTGLAASWLWLLCVNVTLFLLLLKDKHAARSAPTRADAGHVTRDPRGYLPPRRTPEATLLLLTLLGGTPAMFAGRALLRHKSSKQSFTSSLYGVVLLQVALVFIYYRQLLPLLFG